MRGYSTYFPTEEQFRRALHLQTMAVMAPERIKFNGDRLKTRFDRRVWALWHRNTVRQYRVAFTPDGQWCLLHRSQQFPWGWFVPADDNPKYYHGGELRGEYWLLPRVDRVNRRGVIDGR